MIQGGEGGKWCRMLLIKKVKMGLKKLILVSDTEATGDITKTCFLEWKGCIRAG